MIVDLHAHYPMQLLPEAEGSVGTVRGRARLLDRVRALLIRFASRFANYESVKSGPRVTVAGMRAGGVGICLSVLYSPFDEMDLTVRYGSPPLDRYLHTLLRQLTDAEREIAEHHAAEAVYARTPEELEAALDRGLLAMIHSVEGGFHLGSTPEAVDRAVTELAGRGVAYITPAHLFYRGVAANAPAIPFIPDGIYRRLFPQPEQGLSELGRALVRAMVRERLIADVSHMNAAALRETFDLLDEIDPRREVPVIASHVAYRFGDQTYNLDEQTVLAIAARDGVIGLICAEHQAADGIRMPGLLRRRHTRSAADSMHVLGRHIDRIAELTGSHRHTAIGTDFDGYIKPTLAGLENSSKLGALERELHRRYGPADAAAIASQNALRLLRGYWRR